MSASKNWKTASAKALPIRSCSDEKHWRPPGACGLVLLHSHRQRPLLFRRQRRDRINNLQSMLGCFAGQAKPLLLETLDYFLPMLKGKHANRHRMVYENIASCSRQRVLL